MPLAIAGVASQESEPLGGHGRELLERCDIVINWTPEAPDDLAHLQSGAVVIDGVRLDRARRLDRALTYARSGHNLVYLLDAGPDLEGLDEFTALLGVVPTAETPGGTLR